MTEQAEIDARARELISEAAREAESSYIDSLRERAGVEIFMRVKRGMKAAALFETGIGKAFADRCNRVIVNACDTWLSIDSKPEDVEKALTEARGAIAAMNCFGDIVNDGKEAEQQLRQIDHEIGVSDE